MESTGPDLKVRGPAAHIYEKYQQLARDAHSAGDRVMAENYLQHAEHYYRMLRAMQPNPQPVHNTSNERFGGGEEYDDEGDVEGGADDGMAPEGADQPEVEFPGAGPVVAAQNQGGDRDGFRRGRRRRGQFRPGEGEREGGPEGQAREPSPDRNQERGPRESQSERGPDRAPRENQAERGPRDGPRDGQSGPRDNGDRGPRGPREDRPPREERTARDGGEEAEGFSSGPRPAFLGSD
jgi:Domain of unknown function (DUF4167)